MQSRPEARMKRAYYRLGVSIPESLRRETARALGTLGLQAGRPVLVRLLLDRSPDVRFEAFAALGRLGWVPSGDDSHDIAYWMMSSQPERVLEFGVGALPYLKKASEDADVSYRAKARWALWRIADVENEAGQPSDRPVHDSATEVRAWQLVWNRQWSDCLGVGAIVVPALLAYLEDSIESTVTDGAAAAAFAGLLRVDGIERYYGRLQKHPALMQEAISLLASRRGPASRDDHVAILSSKTWMPYWGSAAEALQELGWQPTRTYAGAAYFIMRGRWRDCMALGTAAVEALRDVENTSDEMLPCSAPLDRYYPRANVRAHNCLVELTGQGRFTVALPGPARTSWGRPSWDTGDPG